MLTKISSQHIAVKVLTSLVDTKLPKLRVDVEGEEGDKEKEKNEIYVGVNIISFSEPILLQFSQTIGIPYDNVCAKWRFAISIAAKA
ncbi:MAG: hypothetical protein GY820_22010 [Gammaproteobacteria bacterium]|nr:hypothetical protein [Gammaproteobacteria bacterium]